MSLTPCQLAVADAICEGLLHKQIAAQLNVSRQTVDKHVSAVYVRTGTHNVGQLFWWMIRNRAGKTYERARELING